MDRTTRRYFLGVAAVGAGGALVSPTAAAAAPGDLPAVMAADQLQVGDVLVGPGGSVVRLHAVEVLSNGDRRLLATAAGPPGAESTPLLPGGAGYPSTQPFVVLARAVPVAAFRLGTDTADVIDGGTP